MIHIRISCLGRRRLPIEKSSIQQEIQKLIDSILKEANTDSYFLQKQGDKKIDAWYVVAELRRILLLDGVTVKEVNSESHEERDYDKLQADYSKVLSRLCELQEKEITRLK